MKRLWLFTFLLISISLTSCFELIEQISMNEDGSGEMTVTLNMSESKDQLQRFMQAEESVPGIEAPNKEDMDAFFKKVVTTVGDVKGISNVKSDIYYEDFVFSISASFDDVKAMNTAVNKFTKGMSRGMLKLKNDYAFENGIFKRSFISPITADGYDDLPVMQRMILESARIISVYRFEKAIAKMSSKSMELSHDSKEARFESTLSDIVKGLKSPSNEISF